MPTDSTPNVSWLMAGVVDNRIRLWMLVREATSRPDEALVERLDSGEWMDDVRVAARWLGDAAQRFLPGLTSVEAAVKQEPVTLARLIEGYDIIVAGERTSLAESISDLMGQLAAERRAWAAGDDEHAKTLRLAEHDLLHTLMVPAIQQWCHDALHQQSSAVLSALIQVVVIVLSMETGRDFEQGMQGRAFRITDDLPRE